MYMFPGSYAGWVAPSISVATTLESSNLWPVPPEQIKEIIVTGATRIYVFETDVAE